MIKRPLQQTKVHIVHKTIEKSQMTTDYVKRHGLKPTMRAFSVNDTMINGAPEHSPIYTELKLPPSACISLPRLLCRRLRSLR